MTKALELIVLSGWALLGLSAGANAMYFIWLARQRRTPERWPRVSILIPARDEATNLARLLPSITSQDYPDLEVVVYDDGSSDGTSDMARRLGGDRIRVLRGDGPPPGWAGKPHACYQAAAAATGEVFLFLDADTAWQHPGAVRRLVSGWLGLKPPAVLTALPRFAGGGLLLVSVLGIALMFLPLPLAAWMKRGFLGALNGQCWLIGSDLYRRLEPHREFRESVVEDVQIGQWLLGQGIVPWATLATHDLTVWMYPSLGDAWQGFRKNFYYVSGGTKLGFAASWLALAILLLIGPLLYPMALGALYLAKFVADRAARLPLWISLLAPLTSALALAMYLDSAVAHWRGKVMWKGRAVRPIGRA
ncbi:MAG: glycosyltransferase [Gemmatimonadales bacterium]